VTPNNQLHRAATAGFAACCRPVNWNIRVHQMRPSLRHLSTKGIAGGVLALLLLYAAYSYIAGLLVASSAASGTVQPYLIIGGYLVYLLAGYATDLFVKVGALVNAVVVGALVPIANAGHVFLTSATWSSVAEALLAHGAIWFVAGVVFCSVGGLIWDAQQRLTA